MKISDANLKTIFTLREKFKCNVGYSGHETGLTVSRCGCLGISSIERHITLTDLCMDVIKRHPLSHLTEKLVPEIRKINCYG